MTKRRMYWFELRYKLLRAYRNLPWVAWWRRRKILKHHIPNLLNEPFPPSYRPKQGCRLRFLYEIEGTNETTHVP